ncbi:MAG TPA: DUF4476 domain-containing protein [Bacteroidia bacterium]|nr:DUF4476 domain-containing protein [Bacteroidia bacterium]QQR94873.1 MAG: DUF4476 domain-containing protein [Bacteroidota bacterium]MBP7715346.1 DUF4476 domain-containing protein [Bacteroidia bacterium]MBP8669271.1 DUF4476 domain-containing protein [Bacteroidia bacterium]HOZ81515.1 DUF4476 domain-containing protein [Bacteroidia bacterium]
MKNTFFTVAFILCAFFVKAQSSNVILFTENGEKFFAILNGVRQNTSPETNVKVTGLNANFYKLKVIFEDTKLGEKDFNLAFNPGMETTFSIKFIAKKNSYVLRPLSEVPLAQALPPAANQTVVAYSEVPAPPPAATTVTHTTTTTTTDGTPMPGDNVNVNIGVNMNEAGGGINMNVSGGTTQTTTHTTTTTVTHTTTSEPTAPPIAPPPPAPVVYLPGYNGPYGCPVPMAPQDFSELKQSISSKSFEDSKMTIAKQVLRNNCLFTSQVKDLMGLFTFEESKLDFAKYAYDYTYDIGNYFKVNDMFTFESSIDDLNNYINSKH